MKRIPDDAFEQYVALGPGRSYQALANTYGVSKTAIANVASKQEWSARLERIERRAREESDRKLVESMGEMRERHIKTVRAMHARALTALKQYPLNSGMEAMKAAEMASKLERVIAGEATERSAVNIEEVTRRELSRWLLSPDDEDDEIDEATDAE